MSLTPPSPAENLAALRIAAETGEPVPPEVSAWLLAGLDRFNEGEAPLDRCLHLTGVAARRARDKALREAATFAPSAMTRWQIAGWLAARLNRFETCTWPRLKSDPARALAQLSGIDRCLARVMMSGAPIAASQRTIYRGLTRD